MVTTNYIWDGESYLAEKDENDAVTAVYTNVPDRYTNLVSQRRGAATSYAHFDALGSTKQLTDQSGAVTDEFEYDAWGNEIAHTGTTEMPFRYVGRHGYYRDGETNSIYILARTYQPDIARWWSQDPLTTILLPQIYLYTENNPAFLLDISGLQAEQTCPVNKSELVYMAPTGGNTSTNLGITIVSQYNPIIHLGECGRYQWIITWYKPKPNPFKNGTFLLQNIAITYSIYDCDGNDITLDQMAKRQIPPGNKNGGKTWDFWEAWQFSQGKQYTDTYNTMNPGDDWYQNGGFDACTTGTMVTQGRYIEAIGKVPTPPMFIGNVPLAGNAPSSLTEPKYVTTKDAKFRKHDLTIKWDCCCD